MTVADVTDETFDTEVLSSEVPVVVDFWAPWCRPCRAIEPHLTELAEASGGRLRLVKLDIDTNLGVPSRYGVLTVPTVMLFAGGELQVTIVGARPLRHFAEAFAPWTADESGSAS
jgi:thioredoxin 1